MAIEALDETPNLKTEPLEAVDSPTIKPDLEEQDADDSDDTEDDQYVLTENAPRAQRISEKNRKDVGTFQNWLTESQREGSEVQRREKGKVTQRASAADRLLEKDSCKIIDAPREYQMDMFERAKEKNIIVVLDTGSGKTLIAILLLNHMLDAEIERRAVEGDMCTPKTAFFIVEKVALCMQQYRALCHNLGHPIGLIHGDLQGLTNRKDFWQNELSENRAIVTTAQVLLDSLSNGFISMKQINLLVFDEAHHTKKNHPYAKIMKSHYLRETDTAKRPKILGMTASPVDAQTKDMRAAAAELESMMCSEIATVSDEILRMAPRATELYEQFARLLPTEQTRTTLWEQISALTSDNHFFRTVLDFTEEASSTFGPWCADRFWSILMTDLEVAKLLAKTQGDLGNQSVEAVNQAAHAVKKVQKLIKARSHELDSEAPTQVSSKFQLLLDILKEQFEGGASRCIIFVEKRYTALLLSKMLKEEQLRIPGVIPAYMVRPRRDLTIIHLLTLLGWFTDCIRQIILHCYHDVS